MTARIIDGKAIAADLRGKVADEVQRLRARARRRARARGRAGRRRSGERSLCPQQGQGDGRGRHAVVRPPAAGRPSARPSCWRWSRKLNADPAVHGILVQLPLPPQIDAQKVLAAIDPAKDVDGFHPVNAGRLADRPAGAGALHAARLRHAGQDRARRRSPAWRRWWSAAPTSSASRWRNCCWPRTPPSPSPIPRRAICRRCAAAPTSWSPRSAGRRWCAATGSSRARP